MRAVRLAVVFAVFTTGAIANPRFLSEQQAVERGAAILKGDPYGSTYLEITKHITQASLILDGSAHCGTAPPAVWSLHVVVPSKDQPIDGYLELEARTGKMLCASLPFLD